MQNRSRRTRLLLCAAQAALLTACGGGGDGSQANGGGGTSNAAPQISGTPVNAVVQGQTYSFTPSATDPNGDTLTFSVANLPGWATFSTSTGRVTGTPGANDVGMYSNVQITVSDGQASAALTPFSIQVVGTATGSALLTWTPPTQNTDGSPLNDLAGYKIYWGQTPGSYSNSVTVNNPGLSSYVVDQLTPATWYFVATAINSKGIESTFSNPASKIVQ